MSAPCFNCGSRGSCRHRQAEDAPQSFTPKPDGRKNNNSPWGKKGNPSGKARQRIIDAMKAQLK